MNKNLQKLIESAAVQLADEVRRRKASGIKVIELQTGDPDFETLEKLKQHVMKQLKWVRLTTPFQRVSRY